MEQVINLPVWAILLVISTFLGLVTYIWTKLDGRVSCLEDKGFLPKQDHFKICEVVQMQIKEIGESIRNDMKNQFDNFQKLFETKFDSLDDKIENKILKELIAMNGKDKKRSE